EADGGTVDGGDHRFRHLEDAQRDEAAAVAMLLGTLAAAVEGPGAAAEVGARTERAAGAGDDDGAHAVVGVGAVEGGDELTDDGRVDGVEPVGAVERERRDPVRVVVEQRLEGYQNPRARTSLPPAAGPLRARRAPRSPAS